MSDDLVKRLRDRNSPVLDEDAHEAANRIEELEAALRDAEDALRGTADFLRFTCGTPGEQEPEKEQRT